MGKGGKRLSVFSIEIKVLAGNGFGKTAQS
jgi:hypothetical protein